MSLRLPPLDLFVDGSWNTPRAGRTMTTHDPHDAQPLARFGIADAHDVDTAVRAAKHAQPGWAAWAPQRRAAVLWRLGDLILEQADDLAAEEPSVGRPSLGVELRHHQGAQLGKLWVELRVGGEVQDPEPGERLFQNRLPGGGKARQTQPVSRW